jgi:dihydroorotase
MRDRALAEGTRGHGRSVHSIQQMPPAEPRNTDQSMTSITRVPARSAESAA